MNLVSNPVFPTFRMIVPDGRLDGWSRIHLPFLALRAPFFPGRVVHRSGAVYRVCAGSDKNSLHHGNEYILIIRWARH
jgi:hypothetical protein